VTIEVIDACPMTVCVRLGGHLRWAMNRLAAAWRNRWKL
jgi:hypothetical protein